MKLLRLHIDGFGRFAKRSFGPFERPVTVFYGLNEAGKSTLLEFIRRVFFGFPDGRSSSNPYPPLAGGQHGGNVTIVSDNGESVTVQRFQGTGGGSVRLTAASGEPLPEGELSRLLGHHSKDVFQNVFTFTLDELHDEALLKDDSVNAQIFAAGMGATKLPDALRTLKGDKRNLFLKGGSNHEIVKAMEKIEKIESHLSQVENNAEEYARLTAHLNEVKGELEGLSRCRQKYQSQLDRQRQLESAWDDWNSLIEVDRLLAELPTIDSFPIKGVNRLETLEERIRTAQEEYDSADKVVEEAKADADVVIEHEAILRHSPNIRKLEQGRTSFDNSVRDLRKRMDELEDHKKSLAANLKDLGPDWDEARLESFDLSMTVREEISRFQVRLREDGDVLNRTKAAFDQDKKALVEAEKAKNKAERDISTSMKPILDSNQIRKQRDLIRRAKSRLDSISRVNQRVYDLQRQLDSLKSAVPPAGGPGGSRVAATVSLVLGIALLLAGAIISGPVLPVVIIEIGGIAFVGIAAYLYATGRSSRGAAAESPLTVPVREALCKTETELKNLQSALKQEAAPLGLEAIDEPALIAAEGTLDEYQGRVDRRERLTEALESAKDLTAQRNTQTQLSREAVEGAMSAFGATESKWRQWLADRNLRQTFSPQTVVELRGKVELGIARLLNVRNWRQRIGAIQKAIDDYAVIVAHLASDFGVRFDRNDNSTIAAAADRLIELYKEVDGKVKDRTAAEDDWGKAKRQLAERDRALHKAEEEKQGLLQSGRASDAEDFRNRAEMVTRRINLEEKRRGALGRLQRLSGPGAPLVALKERLRDTDIQAIHEEVLRLNEKHDEINKDISRSSTERGEIQSDLKKLTSEEDSSRLRVERHRLLEVMRGHAREWVIRTIAENLLKKAQGRFERERQPGVIRHAESFFKDITGGRYQTVFSPLGRSEIQVTDSAGDPKQPVQLSRGTREQLFLSLRFGLIKELGQRSERLPVIVDEALVNFDPERGLRAARAFVELSQTNQVLVFTCHPTIVELFQSAAAKLGVQQIEVVRIG